MSDKNTKQVIGAVSGTVICGAVGAGLGKAGIAMLGGAFGLPLLVPFAIGGLLVGALIGANVENHDK